MEEVNQEGQAEGIGPGDGQGNGPLFGVLRQTGPQCSGQVLKVTQVQRERKRLGQEELPGKPSHCLGKEGGWCWVQKDGNRIGVRPPGTEVLPEGH